MDDLGATIFFQLVSARYVRGCIILTSNKSYGDWGWIFRSDHRHGDSRPPAAPFDDNQHPWRELSVEGPAQSGSVPASGGGNQTSPLSLLSSVAERSSPSRVLCAAQNRRALDRSGPFRRSTLRREREQMQRALSRHLVLPPVGRGRRLEYTKSSEHHAFLPGLLADN